MPAQPPAHRDVRLDAVADHDRSPADTPSDASATSRMIGDGLPTTASTLLLVTASTAADHPRAVRDLAALHRARAVGIRRDEPGAARDRLERGVELGVAERAVEGDDDPPDALVVPDLEAVGRASPPISGGSPMTKTGAPGSSPLRWRASTSDELMTSSGAAGMPSRVSLRRSPRASRAACWTETPPGARPPAAPQQHRPPPARAAPPRK